MLSEPSPAGRTVVDVDPVESQTPSTRLEAPLPTAALGADGSTVVAPETVELSPDPDDTGEFIPDVPSTLIPGHNAPAGPEPRAAVASTLIPGPEATVAHEPPRASGTADLYADVTGGSAGTAHEPSDPDLQGTVAVSAQSVTRGLVDTEQVAATGAFESAAARSSDSEANGHAADGAVKPAAPVTPMPSAQEMPDDARCGRYLLKQFHARGGMGEVWLAEDPSIGRDVALKRMLGRRPDQIHRFRVEAQVTGQLEHPGIAPVHELGVDESGEVYYTMKFVQGRTLHQVIEAHHRALPGGAGKGGAGAGADTRELEQSRLLQAFHSLCLTVAYAHSRGVLHRDLKPENVMLGAFGETIVLDWGIAKVLGQPEGPDLGAGAGAVVVHGSSPETETREGTIMGTPSYMAPEVAAGLTDEIDQRSDVYLLGATLYEILTGRRPRRGTTALEMIKQAQHEPPIPASKIKPQVPRALDAICRKAMAQRKEDRYFTALELAEDVERYMAGEPVTAYREGLAVRAWRWARRHRKALRRLSVAALVVAVALVGLARVREAERHRLAAQREAEQLRAQDQARREIREFRRLADEARFFAATTDPVTEHAPYYDPRKGESTARAALAIAAKWGPTLERLPLPEERASLKQEIYDLVLQTAHLTMNGRERTGPQGAREALDLLDRARPLREPTRGEYRLRADAYRRLGDATEADEAQHRADGPGLAATSLDHFFLGEQSRRASDDRTGAEAKAENGKFSTTPIPAPERLVAAIEEYRKALAIQPDHYWSHFQIGRCYLGLGRIPEAVEALGACVALRPEDSWGLSARGLALARQGRFEEAGRDLDRAIRLDPDARPARLTRGVVAWLQDRQDAALADFAAVLEPPDEKRLVEAAYYRGQIYLQRGEVEKALADFDRVVAERPGLRPVYPLRARVRIARGDKAGALADLDVYLALTGDRPEGEDHARRGRLLRLLHAELPLEQRGLPSGRALIALGLAELGKAVTLGDASAQAFDDLGALLELTGRLDTAIAAYSKGLDLAPHDAKLRLKRAWAYVQTGARDQALADLAAAAQSDPENAEAHSGLGYVRALNERPDAAQLEAQLALLHGQDNYLILHNVACIYAALSQTDEPPDPSRSYQDVALALLRRAVALWKRAGTGPDEIALMKAEPAFQPLRNRPDFQQLIGDTP